MDDAYIAKPLGRRQIDQAFPLVRVLDPDVGVDRWRAFAAAVVTGGTLEDGAPFSLFTPLPEEIQNDSDATPGLTGIMTIQDDQGYIHGLFSYFVKQDLHQGRVLSADNVIVLDMVDTAAAAAALLRAMDRTARALDCAAIHTYLPESDTAQPDYCATITQYCREAGHRLETRWLCEALDGVQTG